MGSPDNEAPTADSGRRLTSWKEIAAHLRVSERTAQKWEADHGLPVRRTPGEHGRVIAFADELDAWLRTASEPVSEAAPTSEPRRLFWYGVLSALVLVALSAAVGWWFVTGNPASWAIDGDALVVKDERGKELWRKRFGGELAEYAPLRSAGRDFGWVGDLDGDGRNEVLFSAMPKQEGHSALHCFSSRGTELWSYTPDTSKLPQLLRGEFLVQALIVFRYDGRPRIGVISVSRLSFPSQVAFLSPEGQLLGEYWNSGHIATLKAVDWLKTGRPALYAGGISNSYHQAVLLRLEPEGDSGVSSEELPAYQLPGRTGRERFRLLFPRGCPSRARQPYAAVTLLTVDNNGLTVHVSDEPGDSGSAVILHHLSAQDTYSGASLTSAYEGRHEELRRSGLVDHRLDVRKEVAELSVVQWLTAPRPVEPGQ